MMTLVEKVKIIEFYDKMKIPYTLEDSTDAVQKQGVWYNVKLSNHYFKSLKQVKEKLNK